MQCTLDTPVKLHILWGIPRDPPSGQLRAAPCLAAHASHSNHNNRQVHVGVTWQISTVLFAALLLELYKLDRVKKDRCWQ